MSRSFRMILLVLGVAAVLGFAASARAQDHTETPAEAAHGEAEHKASNPIPTIQEGTASAVTAALVFIAVLGVLGAKAWPKISQGLSDRENKIRSEIEAAEKARQDAKAALDQYQASLAQANAEAKKMLDETKAQQQALAADLRAKADVELTAMRDRARKDIDAAKRAAIAEIYTTTANLAADMAGKILQRQWSPSDQQRLVEDSLRELQTKAN